MKKIPVIALLVVGVACVSLAEAAPKKRAASRVGPYAMGMVGMTEYSGSHAEEEQLMRDILTDNEIPYENLTSSTDASDLGGQIGVGYRFNRYFAAELGFTQFGGLTTTASADLDFPQDELGFQPADLELTFDSGGPMFSALGIFPFNDHFEVFARAGFVLTSFKRGFTSRVNGQSVGGSARSDSQDPVLGLGLTWNLNKVYALRAEYQVINGVGDTGVGTEDLKIMGAQFLMRF